MPTKAAEYVNLIVTLLHVDVLLLCIIHRLVISLKIKDL